MENLTSKTLEVSYRPFNVPSFAETLPAGEYDPMLRLVRKAESGLGAQLSRLYSGIGLPDQNFNLLASKTTIQRTREEEANQATENEGMPSLPVSPPSLRTRPEVGRT